MQWYRKLDMLVSWSEGKKFSNSNSRKRRKRSKISVFLTEPGQRAMSLKFGEAGPPQPQEISFMWLLRKYPWFDIPKYLPIPLSKIVVSLFVCVYLFSQRYWVTSDITTIRLQNQYNYIVEVWLPNTSTREQLFDLILCDLDNELFDSYY